MLLDWPRSGSEHYEQCSNTNLTKCPGFGSAKPPNMNLNASGKPFFSIGELKYSRQL